MQTTCISSGTIYEGIGWFGLLSSYENPFIWAWVWRDWYENVFLQGGALYKYLVATNYKYKNAIFSYTSNNMYLSLVSKKNSLEKFSLVCLFSCLIV